MNDYTVEDVLDMDNYSINQIDDYFIKNKVEVVIYGGKKFVYETNWQVTLTKYDEGIKLEVVAKGTTLYNAMYDAYTKFNNVVKKGAPNLLAPVIEHKSTFDHPEPHAEKVPSDDDIPF